MQKKLKSRVKAKGEHQISRKVKDSAHHIWLAGLGAFAKTQEEGTKLFDSLVKEGEAFEARTKKATETKVDEMRSRVDEVRGKASGNWDKLEQVFEDRVSRALNRLGVPTSKDIKGLADQVDKLTAVVQQLRQESDGGTPVKKRAPRSRTTQSTDASA